MLATLGLSGVGLVGCEAPISPTPTPGTDADQGATDASTASDSTTGSDVLKLDLGSADTAVACPGPAGCPCSENEDCFSGFCLETQTTRQCAQPCTLSCPDGFACRSVSISSSDVVTMCVPRWGRLCDPCLASTDCQSPGLNGATCVRYGDAGSFCGSGCSADADCPTGYVCKASESAEGGLSLQCRLSEEAGTPAVCPCSQRAADKGLQTVCATVYGEGSAVMARCKGVRQCGPGGLSACSAKPSEEVCDGEDNDCDGEVDNGSCDDGLGCTQDVCDGKGSCSHLPLSGLGCDADGSMCTEGDACVSGVCEAGSPKLCDDGNPCTLDGCDPAKGCTQTPDNGKPCDDGIACTTSDTCQSGVCKGGPALTCPSKGPCESATCDGIAGKCVSQYSPAGSPCDDGSSCTVDDKCNNSGDCVGGPKPCSDGNPCTADACDPNKGCVSVPFGGPCDDGEPCTVNDFCEAGSCKAGQQGCNCQSDADCAVLEDGDLCNGTLYCDKASGPFLCKVKPDSIPVCPQPASVCQLATCAPATGICGLVATKEGEGCNADDSLCTIGDQCASGSCVAGSALPCDDNNPCTADSCSPSAGCVYQPAPGNCTDNNACTESDTCSSGVCVGTPRVCDDAKPCTDDACDPGTGCIAPDAPDQTLCSPDGKLWCESGACVVKNLCGNGVIDTDVGETCDDSNKLSWDGCSDKCVSECWSLDFNGKGDVVTLPQFVALPTADTITAELWLRFVQAPLGPATVLSSDCMDVTWVDNNLRVETFANCTGLGSGVQVDVPIGPAPTLWSHLAVQTNNAGSVQVFLNGQPLTVPAVTPVSNITAAHGTAIGARVVAGSGQTQHAPIRATELRVSNLWRYSEAFVPAYRWQADGNTVALWHALEGTGTTSAAAVASNAQNALLTGAIWVADAPQCPTPSPCGNSKLDRAEVCDDGNAANGDGCSAACHLEPMPSCRHLGALFPYLKAGLYEIDPDGPTGPVAKVTLWCAAEANGELRWTLAGNFYDSAGDDMPNETKYVVSGWQQDGLGIGDVQKFTTGLGRPLQPSGSGQESGAVSLAFVEAMTKVAGVHNMRFCFVNKSGADPDASKGDDVLYCRDSTAPSNSNGWLGVVTGTGVANPKLAPYQNIALAFTFGRLAGLAGTADGYSPSLYQYGAPGHCIPRSPSTVLPQDDNTFGGSSIPGICEHNTSNFPIWAGVWHAFSYGMSFKPWAKDDSELSAGTISSQDGSPLRPNPGDKTWGFRLYVGGNLCGNGELEPGESCDDGNTLGGDTCPANCAQ